jgi:hypothetical protein
MIYLWKLFIEFALGYSTLALIVDILIGVAFFSYVIIAYHWKDD